MSVYYTRDSNAIRKFLTVPAVYKICIANMDRWGESNAKSYQDFNISGLPVFSNNSKATKEGYIQDYNGIFYTSAKKCESVGLFFDKMQVGDSINFQNQTYEVVDIEPQGNSVDSTFVLFYIYFRKVKS